MKKNKPERAVRNVSLKAETHRQARIYAACKGMSIQDVIDVALTDFLKRNQKTSVQM